MERTDMFFVVAEIGVNWDGNYELAKEMIKASKDAGCDAVKFQAFKEELVNNHPEKSRLVKSAISKNNVETINEIAKSVGIEWFCTPMYIEAVDFLAPYVKRFKIREIDGRNLLQNKSSKLFERIYQTNKEIIVSSESSPKNSKYYSDSRIKWLYCIPKYPCSLDDLDFGHINDFDGYSNHCPFIIAPLASAINGAKIIEVHITSDKTKPFIDNNVSFDYIELKNLVNLIRQSERMKFQ